MVGRLCVEPWGRGTEVKGRPINRPELLTILCYNYDLCEDYVRRKYGKCKGDFWGWVCDNYAQSEGCLITFSRSRLLEKDSFPDWAREYYGHFLEEFANEKGDLVLYMG